MEDLHGYSRMARGLDFLVAEVQAAGLDSGQLELARRSFGGSPTRVPG
jgi:hypothetical protein